MRRAFLCSLKKKIHEDHDNALLKSLKRINDTVDEIISLIPSRKYFDFKYNNEGKIIDWYCAASAFEKKYSKHCIENFQLTQLSYLFESYLREIPDENTFNQLKANAGKDPTAHSNIAQDVQDYRGLAEKIEPKVAVLKDQVEEYLRLLLAAVVGNVTFTKEIMQSLIKGDKVKPASVTPETLELLNLQLVLAQPKILRMHRAIFETLAESKPKEETKSEDRPPSP